MSNVIPLRSSTKNPLSDGMRALLLASWDAAQVVARDGAPLVISARAAAGMLLEQHGSAVCALKACPQRDWWEEARALLLPLAREEWAEAGLGLLFADDAEEQLDAQLAQEES